MGGGGGYVPRAVLHRIGELGWLGLMVPRRTAAPTWMR